MKLQQGQVWKQGQVYLYVVRLARLAVEYKEKTDLASKAGTAHQITKKEFCRMLKNATLIEPSAAMRAPKSPRDIPSPPTQTVAGLSESPEGSEGAKNVGAQSAEAEKAKRERN